MKNSFLPALLIIGTVALSLWLIRSSAERGSNGPAVFPGIFQLTKRDKGLIASAELNGSTTRSGIVPAGTAGWRVILVAADDDHPCTRSLLLALGEELTHRGAIVMLAPKERVLSEPLPLGCDGSLRISTTTATLPGDAPGPLSATMAVEIIPTRVPGTHPVARWFPDQEATSTSTIVLTHRSSPQRSAAWPAWFAAIGRSLAHELLQSLGTPATCDDTTQQIHLTAWETGAATDSLYGRLPSPPQSDVMERTVAFQHPFVRGWIGRLTTIPITQRNGSARSPRDELERRLKRGQWQHSPATSADGLDQWLMPKRLADGSELLRSITIAADGTIIEWQERPAPITVWQRWLSASATGDTQAQVQAQAQLARHRTTPGIPADLRAPAP